MTTRTLEFYRSTSRPGLMHRLRALVGPVLIGVSVWCAAGTITVADAGTAAARLAVPAPWWLGILAAALAAAIPAWRRAPLTAVPALLAVVPWLPVPVPSLGLLWTGPLAWVPIGAAAMVALAPTGRTLGAPLLGLSAGKATALAGALSGILGLLTAGLIDSRLPGGDEPHYLIITQSLLSDGDLRIENNHDNRDYASYFGGDLAPDVIQRGKDGEIYSIHAPGVAVLVAPAFRLFGYRGAQATVLLLAALTGGLIWRVAFLAAGRSPDAAWFAWLAVAGSTTLLLQSAMVFPDGPGALAVVAGCWLLLRLDRADPPPLGGGLIGVSVGLAALPWLHTRFVVLAFGFGVAVAVYLLRDAGRPLGDRVRRLAVFLAFPVLSAAAWFAFFYLIYGTPNPAAPYGNNPETSLAFAPGGLAGLLFDQQFGLVAATPILVAAVVGLTGKPRTCIWVAVVIVVVYLVTSTNYWMWWAGRPATPARLATAVLPVLAMPVARAWHRSAPALRALWVAVLGWSLATAASLIAVGGGALAWNDRDANARLLEWLGPVVDVPRGWPSFFWRLDPARLETEWPFVVHAAVWLAVPVLLAAALVWLSTRKRWTVPRLRSAAVAWLLVSAMVSVQAGWWLNGSDRLDPARAQTAVLAAADGGADALAIGAFSARRVSLSGSMLVRPEAPGRGDAPSPWVMFAGVPPGHYDVHVEAGDRARGQLLVRLQRAAEPIQVYEVDPLNRTFRIDLPAGARGLLVEPDSSLRRAGVSVALVPVGLDGAPMGGGARAWARYGDIEAFFEDDAVFAEANGFWVRGERAAAFVLVAPVGRETVELQFQNGASANLVEVSSGGVEATVWSLEPSEARQLTVPVGSDGRVRVTVTSSSGFRPSDDAGSGDTRYLGVWVSPL